MLLLHMAGGGSVVFGPLMGRLGRHFEVYAPDLPGHGQSQPLALGPLLPGYAQWALDFLDHVGVKQALIAGHSMGGVVALLCARSAPARVQGLGLICTSAHLTLPAGLLAQIQGDYEGFLASFVAGALPSQAQLPLGVVRPLFPQAPREVVLADFAAVDGMDVQAELGALRLPAVVIGGLDDRITPPPHSQRLAAALGARLVLLEGGHLLPRESPAQVADALAGLAT